jgi:hypothetical protein
MALADAKKVEKKKQLFTQRSTLAKRTPFPKVQVQMKK